MPGKRIIQILILIFLSWACNSFPGGEPEGGSSEEAPEQLSVPRVVPAGPPVIRQPHPDSLKVAPARGRRLTGVEESIEAAKTNTRRAGQPVEIAFVEEPLTFIPGQNGLAVPKKIAAKGRRVPVRYPELVAALQPDFRDNARFNIQVLEVEQGLSSSSFLSILESRRGEMWFGSANGGLSRYDGRYFAHFTMKQGLNSDRIHSMLEDSKGNLWFGMDNYGGITRYDGKNFTHFDAEAGINSRVIYDIIEDRHGNLWFGTEEEGAILYEPGQGSFTFFTKQEGLSSNDIFSIAEDRHGNLWFGTKGGGACKFDGRRFTHFLHIGAPGEGLVASILEDRSGNLWFGTVFSGVYKFDGAHWWQFTTDQGLSNNTVLDILEDQQSKLWFATRGGGACRYEPDSSGGSFAHFTTEEGMSNNTILCLGMDRWGNIWLGTEGSGMCRFSPASFQHFTQQQGLKNNPVRTITESRSGSLWLGTQRGDISRYDGESFTHYRLKAIGSSWIISSLESSRGELWFGTFGGGAIRYDPATGQFTQFSEAEGLSKENVERLLEDKQGNIWIGAFEGGVNRFDGAHFTHFTEKDGLTDNSVISLLEDSRGRLWFGTYRNGVSCYDGKSFANYTTAQGLSHNTVRAIFEDSRGELWFGTEGGGLNRFDGKYFAQYQLGEGLGDNHIRSIQEDKLGNYWIATMDGLYYASFAETEESADSLAESPPQSLELIEYSKADGLKAVDFLGNSLCLDRHNRLWLGTERGVTLLDLNERKAASQAPLAYLQQLELNQHFVDFSNAEELEGWDISAAGLIPFSNYPIEPELPYYINTLAFYFSALDGSQPYKPSFQYRLKEYDQGWSSPAKEAKVEYRNLPSGWYEFELRAIGEAGIWSAPISHSFTIRPPWWLSWWAKGLYFLLGLGILALVRRYELRRRYRKQQEAVERARLEEKSKQADKIKAQAEELERSLQALQEKNAEIVAARDQLIVQEKLASLGQLTTGIAHEIKNPLNFITNYAEDSSELVAEVMELLAANESGLTAGLHQEVMELLRDLRSNSALIEEHGYKIDRIVRSMMDHARGHSPDWELVGLDQLLDENVNLAFHSYRAANQSFNVEIQRDYATELPKIKVLPLQIGRVLLNIITNALYAVNEKQKQHTADYQPIISLSARDLGSAVELCIRDNGTGIPPEIQKEIFTPFFTTKPTGQGNTGLGLSISYDIIVKEHRGKLEVESEAGVFTAFRIELPKEGG